MDNDFTNASNWMKHIPDGTNFRNMLIPGTHDSGAIASYKSLNSLDTWDMALNGNPLIRLGRAMYSFVTRVKDDGWGVAQNLTITEQLNIGIRFMDIRLGLYDGKLYIYHGDDKDYRSSYQPFNDVAQEIYKFLDNNPTDTILMSIKKETGDDVSSQMKAHIDKNSKYWNLNSDATQLSQDVRGKIIVMDRSDILIKCGIGFPTGTYNQDVYEGLDITTKEAYAIVSLDDSIEDQKEIRINFLSASGLPAPGMGISLFSNDVNPYIEGYLADNSHLKYAGIVAMDYPTTNLCNEIIKSTLRTHAQI
ncbi:MAG: phosphatidylinositol-specific phospholipase C domain-containing protein [Alteromonadaceae bacterium]|nr:phosphatidylinositol-specific phospholipase C domain-containing protein [Alteromonadaceae bacterium]